MTDPVPTTVRELVEMLAEAHPMRRGSVSERHMKCGQEGCRCRKDEQARHGPYFSLTRVEGGKTRSRYLDADQARVARQQVEFGQQFRKHLEAYWEACEQWADSQLEASEAASKEAAKKGASKRSSRPRSSAKSKG